MPYDVSYLYLLIGLQISSLEDADTADAEDGTLDNLLAEDNLVAVDSLATRTDLLLFQSSTYPVAGRCSTLAGLRTQEASDRAEAD